MAIGGWWDVSQDAQEKLIAWAESLGFDVKGEHKMAHAEKCPVCGGRGTVLPKDIGGYTASLTEETCHGCGGKGWVEVGDSPLFTTIEATWPPQYDTTGTPVPDPNQTT